MSNEKGFDLNTFYSSIYNRYDLINRLFTFGMDQKWRRVTISACLKNTPGNLLDLCCGTGDLALGLAKYAEKHVKITGYDFNSGMLEIAMIKADARGINTISFVQGDVAQMPFQTDFFDAITVGFGFRNLTFQNPNRNSHIDEIYRVLKPGGQLYILESGVPSNFFVRQLYKVFLYLFLVPLGGIISGDVKAYWYLAKSSLNFYSVAQLKVLLKDFKFKSVKHKKFFLGAANLFIVTK